MSAEVTCPEAEAAVLGALLLLPAREAQALAWRLDVEDFAEPVHRTVFSVVTAVLETDTAADPVTVLGELNRRAELLPSGASPGPLLYELLAAVPVAVMGGHYARVLVEHRVRRRAVEAAERLAQAASGPYDTLGAVVRQEYEAVVEQLDRVRPEPLAVVA